MPGYYAQECPLPESTVSPLRLAYKLAIARVQWRRLRCPLIGVRIRPSSHKEGDMSYWSDITRRRTLSRRRALALGASGLSGAALLAACGGDGENGTATPQETQPSSYTTRPAGAQKAGRMVSVTTVIPNWNPVANFTAAGSIAGAHVYDRLLSAQLGSEPYTLEAAQSIETADPVRIVFKLKPGMVFHDVPPINGRAVTSQDVAASQNYITQAPNSY